MTSVKICGKIDGLNGGILITPKEFVSPGELAIPYVISVSSQQQQINLEADFVIESTQGSGIKTGDWIFQFKDFQKTKYLIKENEDGFSFRFLSNSDKIEFNLIPTGFVEDYDTTVTVDAISSGFGSNIVSLKIKPSYEIIQADNFEDYASQYGFDNPDFGGGVGGTDGIRGAGGSGGVGELDGSSGLSAGLRRPITDKKIKNLQKDKLFTTDKISINNEFNYYSKEYEATKFNEVNLLDLNRNYRTIDIKRYFAFFGKRTPKYSYSKEALHASDYVKDFYPTLDKQKLMFPMFMEIKFETDITKTQLTTFLKQIDMLDYFCYYYINNYSKQRGVKTFSGLRQLILNSTYTESRAAIRNNFIGDSNKIIRFLNKSFQKTILIKLLEKQFSLVRELSRNEILMYRLDKYKNGVLFNSRFFINRFENQELTVFDTQLKYDTEYEYKISKIEILTDDRIIETLIPEYSAKIRIVDSAPLPPDAVFLPYKGIDNQILINMNSSAGRYADYPIIVQQDDVQIFNKIIDNNMFSRQLQNNNKIQFESDDPDSEYQLYRLEQPPSSYADFQNAYQIKTKNTSLVDEIKPNTKYYYIIRAIDVHGNISNPTKPIEIEMVNQNGTIFLLKKEYLFGEETKVLTKDIKSLIQLKPAKQQLEINPELTYDTKPSATSAKQVNLVLGNKDITLWNKLFMMRVTSKLTGKKIDIKFKFTHSQPN